MSGKGRYPWFGVPPAREPRPAADEASLTGKRVILSTPEGFVHDMRAVSERYVDERNVDVIDIVSEEDYYRWMVTSERPVSKPWRSYLVWVDG